jgi:ATP-dependent DNA ligase
MIKIKPHRTADCVVGGFRHLSNRREVGSLLLGLYDGADRLNHVGFTATIPNVGRAALTRRLEALREPPGFIGDAPAVRAGGAPTAAAPGNRGGPNWWSK